MKKRSRETETNSHIVKKTYQLNNGKTLTNINAHLNQEIKVISTYRFRECINKSPFVQKMIIDKRMSIMQGFHPRLGENSPFNKVLSKDLARWWLKEYVTSNTQCFVTREKPKVWTSKDLYQNDDKDIVFTDLEKVGNSAQVFTPHLITNKLVMYPIILQTPKFGVYEATSNSTNKIITGLFHRKDANSKKFKDIIEWIDVRCKEWIFMNLKKFMPYDTARANGLTQTTTQEEYYSNYSSVSNLYYGRSSILEKKLDDKSGIKLNIKYADDNQPNLFDENGYRYKKGLDNFFRGCDSDNLKWIRCIIIIESLISYNLKIKPYFKVLQIQSCEPPKVDPDYLFDSEDE